MVTKEIIISANGILLNIFVTRYFGKIDKRSDFIKKAK